MRVRSCFAVLSYNEAHPTPATSDGIERVPTIVCYVRVTTRRLIILQHALAKPVMPPTTQREPITYAGIADIFTDSFCSCVSARLLRKNTYDGRMPSDRGHTLG